MADGFEVSPATLGASASSLSGVVAELDGKVGDISSTVTSGNPWGADEQGTVFGMLYTAVVSHAIDTVSSHADQLQYATEALTAWANDHEQNDVAVAARFSALGGGS